MKLYSDYYHRLPSYFYGEGFQNFGSHLTAEYFLWNEKLWEEMSMDRDYLLAHPQFFTGRMKNCYHPIAQAYSGHQFGYYTRLGDGRALLLGEWEHEGTLYDISVKGSGPTEYSRGGDGFGTLSSMIREYVVSEFMAAVGIPTTRSLAILKTGKMVRRKVEEPGAILSRMSRSLLRIGTFQYAYEAAGTKGVKELADYAISRFDLGVGDEMDCPYLLFFKNIVHQQAKLIAQWMAMGFVHGVMNTDNSSVIGETIDYGPCAFMETYDPATIFSSIDTMGRYQFQNQPLIMKWNLARLGDCFVSLLSEEREKNISALTELIYEFDVLYEREYAKIMNEKMGLTSMQEGDQKLREEFLDFLYQHELDYTNAFVALSERDDSFFGEAIKPWIQKYEYRRKKEGSVSCERMKKVNPRLIPRANMMEDVLISSVSQEDPGLIKEWLEFLTVPFDYDRKIPLKFLIPTEKNYYRSYRTYCGT